MTKQIFELEWDEENLGQGWMNIYNLELCLYSKEHTRRDLVAVREIKEGKDEELAEDYGGHA